MAFQNAIGYPTLTHAVAANGTATISFGVRVVRVLATAACNVTIDNGQAFPLAPNVPEYFLVNPDGGSVLCSAAASVTEMTK